MKKIPKQEYTAEFKALAVKRVKDGLTVGAAARELGLIDQTLRHWVKAADAGKLGGAGVRPVTPEQMELSRVRAENARLKREVEILKKVTAKAVNHYSSLAITFGQEAVIGFFCGFHSCDDDGRDNAL
jgi:transposase